MTMTDEQKMMHAAADECMSPEQRDLFDALGLGDKDCDVYARLFRCVAKRALLSASEPAAPAQSGEPVANDWKAAIDNELVTIESTADSFSCAREAVKALIDWHVAVALDPAVSSDARALIDKGKQSTVVLDAERAAFAAWFRDQVDKRSLGIGDETVALVGWQARAASPQLAQTARALTYNTVHEHIRATLACNVECELFERHVLPALAYATKDWKERNG